jgi:hypothetical protein
MNFPRTLTEKTIGTGDQNFGQLGVWGSAFGQKKIKSQMFIRRTDQILPLSKSGVPRGYRFLKESTKNIFFQNQGKNCIGVPMSTINLKIHIVRCIYYQKQANYEY